MANALGGLLQQFQQQQESAQAANLQRYEQAMAIYDEIISRYRPGGEFGRAALGQLEKRKVRDVGKETQQLISSGLYGTTTMAATGRRWEEAVGGPERLKLEDIQMQRLSQAQVGKAGFIERREDVGPDYGMIAQLAAQVGQAPTGAVRAGGGGGKTFEEMFPKRAPLKSYWEQQAEKRARLGGATTGPTTGARTAGTTGRLGSVSMAERMGYSTTPITAAKPVSTLGPLAQPTDYGELTEEARRLFEPGAGWQEWTEAEKKAGRRLVPGSLETGYRAGSKYRWEYA